jgi:hypothetical protein
MFGSGKIRSKPRVWEKGRSYYSSARIEKEYGQEWRVITCSETCREQSKPEDILRQRGINRKFLTG